MSTRFLLLFVGLFILEPCLIQSRSAYAQEALRASDAKSRRALLAGAKSWAYQLRIIDLAPLAASNADLLVIDHGYAARQNGKLIFDADDIKRLKTKADGKRRIVLAYLSIGEVEQYRFYWRGDWCKRATAPTWIGAVNPAWPGNYPARFWDPGWQEIILAPEAGYLARIKAQGFDGVYLDRTDVYAEWTEENPSAERDMIAFLDRIGAAARANNPAFLVVMQNAEELLRKREVRRMIDGVAKEDLLHGTDFTEAPNSPDAVAASIKDLQRARGDGIPVFAVEYLTDPAMINAAQQRLTGYGYLAYFAPRLLDRLVAQPGETVEAPTTPRLPPAPATGAPNWAEGAPTCLVD